ncbi:MAG: chemotaxis protein CheW, partial [Mariprofundaceae bacterium]|nr:chemotaxis protein CheW [Mariprofundaceae bacterium]
MDETTDFWMVSEDAADMYLTFQIQDTEYAVNIVYVTEIISLPKISGMPDVPPFIKGVINLRGRVIPLMDVRLRFGLPPTVYNERTPVIVLEKNKVPTGLVVDQVNEVVEIPADQVDPPPRWGEGGKGGVIQGLGKRAEGVSIILDVERLLYDREINMPSPEALAEAAASVT